MLLRRSLFVLDIVVLLAVVVFLVLLPAERCLTFEANEKSSPDSSNKCHLHPVHHPDFTSFTQNKGQNRRHYFQHFVTVCHRLQWRHLSFWDNMYIILLPAITCLLLIGYTVLEICEFSTFSGTVQTTGLILVSVFTTIYTVAVITREKMRIQEDWPLRDHAHLLGARVGGITVDVPATWQYSIAMCLLSALFKVGRILIQHFIGDKKIFMDDDSQRDSKSKVVHNDNFGNFESTEVAGTTRMLNESRYSRIETD